MSKTPVKAPTAPNVRLASKYIALRRKYDALLRTQAAPVPEHRDAPALNVRLTPEYITLRRERDALLRERAARGLQPDLPARPRTMPETQPAHGTLNATDGRTGRTSRA